MNPGCPLCDAPGGHVVHAAARLRVIRVDEAGFPAFYRVVWNDHVAEFTDLPAADRALCMEAVATLESVLRRELSPDKVNLASLGNAVPHLHWHVIARFAWDSHFPGPVWAVPQRAADTERLQSLAARVPALDRAVARAFAGAC